MNLADYDVVIVNSSGGKDSLCAIYEICRMADQQQYDKSKIIVSHQDLGEMEWAGTKELAKRQADHFGLAIEYSKQRNKEGRHQTLLEYVEQRGKWPSRGQRYCTSDFKRGPGARVVTKLTKALGECKVLYVFGFRKDESPERAKKKKFSENKRLKTLKRTVHEYLPIHDWNSEQVWQVIHENGLPYHKAYDFGMPRLSCCFCIFSPFDALVIAGIHNPELLDQYIEVEQKIGHTFRHEFKIESVRDAIRNGYVPDKADDWVM